MLDKSRGHTCTLNAPPLSNKTGHHSLCHDIHPQHPTTLHFTSLDLGPPPRATRSPKGRITRSPRLMRRSRPLSPFPFLLVTHILVTPQSGSHSETLHQNKKQQQPTNKRTQKETRNPQPHPSKQASGLGGLITAPFSFTLLACSFPSRSRSSCEVYPGGGHLD